MLNIQQVNGTFTGFKARPASHAAAAVFLGTSIYVAHEGLARWAPGNLGNALTALFVATAALQWLTGSRKDECEEAGDTERAEAVIAQAWRFGIIEAGLFAMGGLALSGLAINAWSIAGAILGGALFSYSSFRVKWTSCDPVKRQKSTPSNGGSRVHDVLFTEATPELPAPDEAAIEDDETNILRFVKRIEHTHAKFEKDAAAEPARPAPVRLRNAAKRIRMRAQRAAGKEAVAA